MRSLKIIFEDNDIIVCEKPSGVLSQESEREANMPLLLREYLGAPEHYIGVLHRLDREASGLMAYAKNAKAAAFISKQIAEKSFSKEYLAVVKGIPEKSEGEFCDLLFKDSRKNKSYVVKRMRKGVREASCEYKTVKTAGDFSLVKVRLITGRSHQIRVQFASRKMPLLSDAKYGGEKHECPLALWSYRLRFVLPETNKEMCFELSPPKIYPWEMFE